MTLNNSHAQLKTTAVLLMVAGILSGCASALNTAGSADYGCPGMPMGVVCKTPAAVYNSTHLDPQQTEFDTPIGKSLPAQTVAAGVAVNPVRVVESAAVAVSRQSNGPRPVREPARVARIWLAPWVDKSDNLHLATTHYTEIKPRTWTVGKPEVVSGAGYVIPHRAFEAIGADKTVRPAAEQAPAPGQTIPQPLGKVQGRASRDADELLAPPN